MGVEDEKWAGVIKTDARRWGSWLPARKPPEDEMLRSSALNPNAVACCVPLPVLLVGSPVLLVGSPDAHGPRRPPMRDVERLASTHAPLPQVAELSEVDSAVGSDSSPPPALAANNILPANNIPDFPLKYARAAKQLDPMTSPSTFNVGTDPDEHRDQLRHPSKLAPVARVRAGSFIQQISSCSEP